MYVYSNSFIIRLSCHVFVVGKQDGSFVLFNVNRELSFVQEARCSSEVRAFAHGTIV